MPARQGRPLQRGRLRGDVGLCPHTCRKRGDRSQRIRAPPFSRARTRPIGGSNRQISQTGGPLRDERRPCLRKLAALHGPDRYASGAQGLQSGRSCRLGARAAKEGPRSDQASPRIGLTRVAGGRMVMSVVFIAARVMVPHLGRGAGGPLGSDDVDVCPWRNGAPGRDRMCDVLHGR